MKRSPLKRKPEPKKERPKVVARPHIADQPMAHSPTFNEAFDRCVFVLPEHGHGHQQCTKKTGHPGSHTCGYYAQRDAKV